MLRNVVVACLLAAVAAKPVVELNAANYAEMTEGATAPQQMVSEAETMRDEGFFVVAGPVPLRASFDVESDSLSEKDAKLAQKLGQI